METKNAIRSEMQEKLLNFCQKVGNGFSLPIRKFIRDMVTGLILTGSPSVHNIAKYTDDKTTTKKTSERFYFNLNREDLLTIFEQQRLKGDPIKTVIIDFDSFSWENLGEIIQRLQSSIPQPALVAFRSIINPDDIRLYKKNGFANVIAKPFHLSEVSQLIERYF